MCVRVCTRAWGKGCPPENTSHFCVIYVLLRDGCSQHAVVQYKLYVEAIISNMKYSLVLLTKKESWMRSNYCIFEIGRYDIIMRCKFMNIPRAFVSNGGR